LLPATRLTSDSAYSSTDGLVDELIGYARGSFLLGGVSRRQWTIGRELGAKASLRCFVSLVHLCSSNDALFQLKLRVMAVMVIALLILLLFSLRVDEFAKRPLSWLMVVVLKL
jgi:hypothetical protein